MLLHMLDDYDKTSAHLSQHYFYQDLLVANMIYNKDPEKHIDIGSRVDGFVAHIASFRKVEIFDIRPLHVEFDNISYKQVDLMDIPMGICIRIVTLYHVCTY